ncbi:MAG: hypothetical protein JO251_00230 [Verrucomicrobia bacterium]|nr:hypothetical protein [Verrucomicrobiota bacterium]
MNELTTFAFAHGEVSTTIRVVTINGEPWRVAADVCRALGLVNTARALSALAADEKGVHSMNTPAVFSMLRRSTRPRRARRPCLRRIV